MITSIEQEKTLAGSWIVIVRTSKDFDYLSHGPYIWWETDGTGEKGLARMIKGAMR